jgi:hypothetical protein
MWVFLVAGTLAYNLIRNSLQLIKKLAKQDSGHILRSLLWVEVVEKEVKDSELGCFQQPIVNDRTNPSDEESRGSNTRCDFPVPPRKQLGSFLEVQYPYHSKSESKALGLPNPNSRGTQGTIDRWCQPLWHLLELCSSSRLGRSILGGRRAFFPG